MPIIVAGKLIIKPNLRDEFISKSIVAISLARKNKGCQDFSVSPDPIDPNRVNIFEKWLSQTELNDFRGSSSENDIFSMVASFDVNEYEVST